MSIFCNAGLQVEAAEEDDNSTNESEWKNINLSEAIQIIGEKMDDSGRKLEKSLTIISDIIGQFKIPALHPSAEEIITSEIISKWFK